MKLRFSIDKKQPILTIPVKVKEWLIIPSTDQLIIVLKLEENCHFSTIDEILNFPQIVQMYMHTNVHELYIHVKLGTALYCLET